MARTQTLVQLSEELVSRLDERAARTGASRSHLIRAAIEAYLADAAAAEIDAAIVAGYTRTPQAADRWAEQAARQATAEEPW